MISYRFNEALPGTVGRVRLECRSGALVASHGCVWPCAAGAELGIRLAGASSALSVPFGGLGLDAWLLEPCSRHFGAGALGDLGLLCRAGQPQLFGRCAEVPACAALDESEAVQDDMTLWAVGVTCALAGVALCSQTCLSPAEAPVEDKKLAPPPGTPVECGGCGAPVELPPLLSLLEVEPTADRGPQVLVWEG